MKSSCFVVVLMFFLAHSTVECYRFEFVNKSGRDVTCRVKYVGETHWPLIDKCTLCPDEKQVSKGKTWRFDTGAKIITKVEVVDSGRTIGKGIGDNSRGISLSYEHGAINQIN